MTRNMKLTVATVLALALAAGAVQAKGWGEGRMGDRMGGPSMALDLATLDADGDGKITKAEMEAHRAARLAAMDPDGDGFITLEEMKAHANIQAKARAEAMVDRMFGALDADKDGKLSAAEALSGKMMGARFSDRLFDRVDADGDGAVTKEEFDKIAERMDRRGGQGEGHGKKRN